MHTASHSHILIVQPRIQVLDINIGFLEANLWVILRSVQGSISELVSAGIIRILHKLILFSFLFLSFSQSFLLCKLFGILLIVLFRLLVILTTF